jgi:multimeric flavodoxin WrbA
VTAQLKTLIDRMADAVHCQLLAGKYCCNLATGGSNYDQVTGYLDSLMVTFGAFVTGSVGAEMGKGPAALEEGERKARDLGRALAEDIRTKRDYVEQRRAQEGIRSHFKELVRLNKDNWEHEYEHWNSINWR